MQNPLHPDCMTGVSVVERGGEWHVVVLEDGDENVRVFEVEQHALSYAEGQKVRLGLTGSHVERAAQLIQAEAPGRSVAD